MVAMNSSEYISFWYKSMMLKNMTMIMCHLSKKDAVIKHHISTKNH